MTLSHYLNQWWLLINEVLWHSSGGDFVASDQANIQYNKFENYTFEITATSPRGQWVNCSLHLFSMQHHVPLWHCTRYKVENKLSTHLFIINQIIKLQAWHGWLWEENISDNRWEYIHWDPRVAMVHTGLPLTASQFVFMTTLFATGAWHDYNCWFSVH